MTFVERVRLSKLKLFRVGRFKGLLENQIMKRISADGLSSSSLFKVVPW